MHSIDAGVAARAENVRILGHKRLCEPTCRRHAGQGSPQPAETVICALWRTPGAFSGVEDISTRDAA